MKHKTVKATAQTTAEKGVFSAIAATYSVDRAGERIIPGAFEKTIVAWQASGKMIPLHWDHQASADSVMGYVDPASMKEMDEGLYVEGRLDIQSSDVAKEAWRSMKNNAVSLSFGYLPKLRKGKDGVTEITEIDLFEVSIVPAPANADTKLLSLKSANQKAVRRDPEACSMEKPWAVMQGDEAMSCHATEEEARAMMDKGALVYIADLDSVQDFLDQKFPGHKVVKATAVEDGGDEEPVKAKSAPQDPLVKEAWDLIVGTPGFKPESKPEPEPEPLDAASVNREAWARVLNQ